MKGGIYTNIAKVTKMIIAKGYDNTEANEIAIQCFHNMKATNNGMPIEWFVNKIVDKQEWLAYRDEFLH